MTDTKSLIESRRFKGMDDREITMHIVKKHAATAEQAIELGKLIIEAMHESKIQALDRLEGSILERIEDYDQGRKRQGNQG